MTDHHRSVDVLAICSECQTLYLFRQTSRGGRQSGRFDCINCEETVQMWSGFYDFHDWRIVEKPEPESSSG